MAASQRVSRGFHRLLFLCAVCAGSQSFAAQITDIQTKFSMLCVAEKATGFYWKDHDWVQANYVQYSYILTKVEPVKPAEGIPPLPFGLVCQSASQQISPVSNSRGESRSCYELKKIGETDASDTCGERWNKTANGYVLRDVICEGFGESYQAEVDGPFVRTTTAGLFLKGEERDDVMLQIGKCSLLTGTPNEK